jgi:hypothetical protein
LDNDYELVVVSSDNYIEKTLQIDTRNIALQNWKYKNSKNVSIGYEVQIQLFKPIALSCQNFAFLEKSPEMYLKYNANAKDIIDIVGDNVINQIKKERRKSCDRKVLTQKLRFTF